MFREAIERAANFTWPIILSRRTTAGECSAIIGTFVVLNDQGWAITAAHIINNVAQAQADRDNTNGHNAALQAINADANLSRKDRQRQINRLGRLRADATTHFSVWAGRDGAQLADVTLLPPPVDLAVFRLQPFDPAWCAVYPTLKNPADPMSPGVSLCKLGFPFHQITPIWHDGPGRFELPPGAVPPPLFPIEGILTRFVDIPGQNQRFPCRHIETSSPGLIGQSGGPTFDVDGAIWALQCQTAHYALDFDPTAPNMDAKTRDHLRHQFLNVGRGVHVVTIVGLLQQLGVNLPPYA